MEGYFNKDYRILIVDDKISNTLLLEAILEEGDYEDFLSITDSRKVLSVFQDYDPDIILLDLHMPFMDGFDVMKQLRETILPNTFLPILVLTADITYETKCRALSSGATDFVAKPFDPVEVSLRIRNLLHTRSIYLQLQNQNEMLDHKVHVRTQQLEESRIDILNRLAKAAEYRDDETGEHTQRVGIMAGKIAQKLGLPEKQAEQMRLAAPLHDLGKIGIPDSILLKTGKLNFDEMEIMKTHTILGSKILSGSMSPLLQLADEIAYTHHEYWNGKGYFGMAGEEIPLSGRIVAVVDVFDALTHDRAYKAAWSVKDALTEIKNQKEKQFDPQIVEAFFNFRFEKLIVDDY